MIFSATDGLKMKVLFRFWKIHGDDEHDESLDSSITVYDSLRTNINKDLEYYRA